MPLSLATLLVSVIASLLLGPIQQGRPSGTMTDAAKPHPGVVENDEAACLKCHRRLVTNKFIHGPVALPTGSCLRCHVAERRGDRLFMRLAAGATGENQRALCVTCHEDLGEGLEQKYVHAPAQSGDCGTCHDPHGSEFRYQMSADGPMRCLTCHDDIRETLASKFVHDPASVSCGMCHDAHASKHPAQTRLGLNELCLQCHYDAAMVADDAAPPVDLLVSAREMASKGRRLHLDRGARFGHPDANHPVQGPRDPMDPKRPLTCVSCHNPHGGAVRQLFRFGATSASALCVKCHQM